MQHFNDLLNDDQTTDLFEETILSQSVGNFPTPTLEEVELVIGKLKLNISPGPDSIPAEFFKRGCPVLNGAMLEVILVIWEDEVLPTDWIHGILCPIHKKGDPTICSNYRGISLLIISYKIFSNIL